MDLHSALRWLLGSPGTPTITLGPITFPAQVLPLLVSTIFTYHKYSRVQVTKPRDVEKGKPAPSASDVNKQFALSDLREPDVRRKYLAKTLLVYHAIVTYGAIIHAGADSLLPHEALCLTQAITLSLHGWIVKPSAKKSCFYTAGGWIFMSFLDNIQFPHPYFPLFATIALACPVAWQIDGEGGDIDLQQVNSALLLMMLSLNRLAFASQEEAKEWVEQSSFLPRTGYFAALLIPNGVISHYINRSTSSAAQETIQNQSSQQDASSGELSALEYTQSLAKELASALSLFSAFMLLLTLSTIATGLLAACLPWAEFVFSNGGRGALCKFLTLPFIFGMALHMAVFSIVINFTCDLDEKKRTNQGAVETIRSQLSLFADVIGWSCTTMDAVWMMLKAISWFR